MIDTWCSAAMAVDTSGLCPANQRAALATRESQLRKIFCSPSVHGTEIVRSRSQKLAVPALVV
jgi:hypothetical protein